MKADIVGMLMVIGEATDGALASFREGCHALNRNVRRGRFERACSYLDRAIDAAQAVKRELIDDMERTAARERFAALLAPEIKAKRLPQEEDKL